MSRDKFEALMKAHNIVLVGDAAWRVAQLVAAAEREACAKLCERIKLKGREVFADAIRSRNESQ